MVDDHHLVRFGISRLLADSKGLEVVGEAASGEEAVQFVREVATDVVLMDIRMPGIGGLEAMRKILRYAPDIKVIAVTAMDDNLLPVVFTGRASGYISKGAGPEEMIMAIQKAHCGQNTSAQISHSAWR